MTFWRGYRPPPAQPVLTFAPPAGTPGNALMECGHLARHHASGACGRCGCTGCPAQACAGCEGFGYVPDDTNCGCHGQRHAECYVRKGRAAECIACCGSGFVILEGA